jgi:hypothetical protein
MDDQRLLHNLQQDLSGTKNNTTTKYQCKTTKGIYFLQ